MSSMQEDATELYKFKKSPVHKDILSISNIFFLFFLSSNFQNVNRRTMTKETDLELKTGYH